MSKQPYVRDLMVSNVWKVRQTLSIREVVKQMAEKNIGAAIVVDEVGHTCGIFTERDLLKRVVALGLSLDLPVSQAMTKDLVCAQMHDEIASIPEMMLKGGFRHIPVLDGFDPVGILSVRDLLGYFMELSKK